MVSKTNFSDDDVMAPRLATFTQADLTRALQGIQEPPTLKPLPPLVPESKPKRRKSQAYLIKVAHNAGLIVERLHPDGSVQVRDNDQAGLQPNGQAYENSWDEVLHGDG
jgi:hypothetical protein